MPVYTFKTSPPMPVYTLRQVPPAPNQHTSDNDHKIRCIPRKQIDSAVQMIIKTMYFQCSK